MACRTERLHFHLNLSQFSATTFKLLLCFLFLFILAHAGSSLLRGLFSSCGEQASHSAVSLADHGLQGTRVSVTGACGLNSQVPEHRLRSCGAQAQLLRGMWDLPRSGLNPCLLHRQGDSPALSHQGSPRVLSSLDLSQKAEKQSSCAFLSIT